MPKIAIDKFGRKKIVPIVKGRLSIVCYQNQPNLWQYRQLKNGSKLYKYTRLNETSKNRAIAKAKELFNEYLESQNFYNTSITYAIDHWITIKRIKYAKGEINYSSFRSFKYSMKNVVNLYLTNYLKLETISEIGIETFIDFNDWRTNKFQINSNNKRFIPAKASTINKDLNYIREWYTKFLIPSGYVTNIPTIKYSLTSSKDIESNPPIILKKHWNQINMFFKDHSINNKIAINSNRSIFFREIMSLLIFSTYNTGINPKYLLGYNKKLLINNSNRMSPIIQTIHIGLRWSDVVLEKDIEEIDIYKKNKNPNSYIIIKDEKSGKKRELPIDIGLSFLRWKKFSIKFRQYNNLEEINPDQLVFINPFTNSPYSYSQITNAWLIMRKELSHTIPRSDLYTKFTLSSLRNSYIINQIKSGTDIYHLSRLTGRSLRLIKRFYNKYH